MLPATGRPITKIAKSWKTKLKVATESASFQKRDQKPDLPISKVVLKSVHKCLKTRQNEKNSWLRQAGGTEKAIPSPKRRRLADISRLQVHQHPRSSTAAQCHGSLKSRGSMGERSKAFGLYSWNTQKCGVASGMVLWSQ